MNDITNINFVNHHKAMISKANPSMGVQDLTFLLSSLALASS